MFILIAHIQSSGCIVYIMYKRYHAPSGIQSTVCSRCYDLLNEKFDTLTNQATTTGFLGQNYVLGIRSYLKQNFTEFVVHLIDVNIFKLKAILT